MDFRGAIVIRRQFPVVLKRRGIEMRLVMKPTEYRAAKIDLQLVSPIAKGHVWFEDWMHGRIKGYRDIVERESISASYAGDMMKLPFYPRFLSRTSFTAGSRTGCWSAT